jgi:hypothetical protein
MNKENPAARKIIEEAIERANSAPEAGMTPESEMLIVVQLVYTAYVDGFGAGMINAGIVKDASQYPALHVLGRMKFPTSSSFDELRGWCAQWGI